MTKVSLRYRFPYPYGDCRGILIIPAGILSDYPSYPYGYPLGIGGYLIFSFLSLMGIWYIPLLRRGRDIPESPSRTGQNVRGVPTRAYVRVRGGAL